MDAAERDRLIRTALFDRDGETVEGAFVDHFVYYAETARDELEQGFKGTFTENDVSAIQAALRQPGVPTEAGARLLLALKQWLPNEAEAIRQSDVPELRAMGILAACFYKPPPEEHNTWLKGLEDPSALVRLNALRTLIENRLTVPDYPDLLRKRVKDIDLAVRRLAVKQLNFYRNQENQAALAHVLKADSDVTVRKAALIYLAEETRRHGITQSPEEVAEILGEELVQQLIAGLEHPDPKTRATVARALERLGGIAVTEAMIARLKVETNEDARSALLYYPRYSELGEVALPLLLATLHDAKNLYMRAQAAWLLPAFGAKIEPNLIAVLDRKIGPRRAS